MVERVEIGVTEAGPDAPEAVSETVTEETSTEETQQTEEETHERPDWLPNKFESPESMAKAYGELERKLSTRTAEEKGLLTADDLQQYSDEFDQNGSLSDKAYDTLTNKGFSRELVDQFIQGQQALQTNAVAEMYSLVGGEEAYNAMTSWASENFNQSDLDVFNEAVQGNAATAAMAIRGMFAQFKAANGNTPTLVQGVKTQEAGGYGSVYEMQQDMKDPRYKAGDLNFHALVDRRLAATKGDVIQLWKINQR